MLFQHGCAVGLIAPARSLFAIARHHIDHSQYHLLIEIYVCHASQEFSGKALYCIVSAVLFDAGNLTSTLLARRQKLVSSANVTTFRRQVCMLSATEIMLCTQGRPRTETEEEVLKRAMAHEYAPAYPRRTFISLVAFSGIEKKNGCHARIPQERTASTMQSNCSTSTVVVETQYRRSQF